MMFVSDAPLPLPGMPDNTPRVTGVPDDVDRATPACTDAVSIALHIAPMDACQQSITVCHKAGSPWLATVVSQLPFSRRGTSPSISARVSNLHIHNRRTRSTGANVSSEVTAGVCPTMNARHLLPCCTGRCRGERFRRCQQYGCTSRSL